MSNILLDLAWFKCLKLHTILYDTSFVNEQIYIKNINVSRHTNWRPQIGYVNMTIKPGTAIKI